MPVLFKFMLVFLYVVVSLWMTNIMLKHAGQLVYVKINFDAFYVL